MQPFLKTFIDLISYSVIPDRDLKNTTHLCLSKLALGLGAYLGKFLSEILMLLHSFTNLSDHSHLL